MTERVLVVAHNHPEFHPGGTEIFAHDLFRAYGRVGGVSTLFLAATNETHRQPRPGTVFQSVGKGENEVVMWGGHFDQFFLSQVDTYGTVPDLQRLLEEFRPDGGASPPRAAAGRRDHPADPPRPARLPDRADAPRLLHRLRQ